MLSKETKEKINRCRDILVGQLPLPSDQVELITIALIYKFMDDIDEKSRKLSGAPHFFKDELQEYSWQNLISNQLGAEERVSKFIHAIDAINKSQHIEELFKNIFKNTFLKFRDGRILKMFLDEINTFEYSHSEELGNAFEYLLNSMGTQGENGQFRTPRNIIDFIVEVVDPDKNDKILDPACGTAGFLISAYKHILRKYTSGYEEYRLSLNNYEVEGIDIHWGDKLLQSEKENISKQIVGYDITPLMVRLSQVNMYLHHFPNPLIHEYDTLSNKNRWNDKFDCILANPPFMTPTGGIDPHSEFRIRAKKAEILFSDYILEHLTPNGKAGWIVPEGIIFQGGNDYVALRKWLIEEMGLWAVVSLPAMIFQPYSGVKTSILLVDRAFARTTDNILLVKIENDGYSLNTNRNPIKDNDLPAALNLLTAYKKESSAFLQSASTTLPAYEIQYEILNRKEFSKLDSYSAVSAAVNFCKKEFKAYTRASDKQKDAAAKKFLKETGFHAIPLSESDIKSHVDNNLKDEVIKYGEDINFSKCLPSALVKFLDKQRDFILSVDKHLVTSEIVTSEYRFVHLIEVCDFFNDGDWIEKKDQSESGIRLIQTNNIGISTFINNDKKARYISEKTFNELNCTEVLEGDILISRLPSPIGRACIIPKLDTKAITSVDCTIVRTNASSIIPGYLLAISRTQIYFNAISKFLTGASRGRISRSNLGLIEIPLPPLEIQQQIVAEIEQYQKVIDGCNLIINNYKPSFPIDSSWPSFNLGSIADFEYGYTTSGLDSGDTRYIRITDIDEFNNLSSTGCKYLNINEEAQPYKVNINDILIARTGATFGKCLIITEPINAVFASYLIRVKLKEEISPKYFWIYAQTEEYWRQANKLVSGAGQPQFNANAISRLKIPVPPIQEQEKIIASVNQSLVGVDYCRQFKAQMESKIQEVISSVWKS